MSETLRGQNEELRRRLAELDELNRALLAGQVDAVLVGETAAPVLLQRAQDALRASERQFRAVFNEALDAIVIADDDGRYIDANPAAARLMGLPREQLLGRALADDFAEPRSDFSPIWNAFRTAGHLMGEFRLHRMDRTVRDTEISARADFLPGFHLAIIRDVTERNRDAAERRASEHRYRLLFEAIPQPVLVTDASTRRLVAANDAACRQYGYSLEEFLALTADDLRAAGATPVIGAFLPAGEGTTYRGSTQHRKKDGTPFDASIACHALSFEGGQAILSVVTDVTESTRAEQALRASEERFRRIVETAAEGVWLLDADDLTSYVNQRMADMLGYSREEMIGRHVLEFVVASAQADTAARLKRHRSAGGEQFERILRRKTGSELSVFASTSPVRNAMGEYQGALAMVTDMTERRQLESQLQHAQRMDSIGRFAGGIAHDFNNLLAVIMGYSDAALRRLPDAEATRTKIEAIQKAADKAAALTRQILAFSRKQVLVPKVLDLGTIVDDLSGLLRRLIGEDVELTALVHPDLGRVCADPSQVEQVIVNLAVNARDAMPRGGKLVIELRNTDVDHDLAAANIGLRPGSYVTLEVRDTGVGIPPEIRQRIFEPFYTTKEDGKGTGLGLATVYGIVKQSEGYISVRSEVGEGTAFTVFLPRVASSPRTGRDARSDVELSPRGTETILFVEDDDVIRMVAEETLTAFGYKVVVAKSGQEALETFRSCPERPSVLVSDVVMPGINGRELADKIRADHPNMPVLLISGYSSDYVMRQQVAEEGRAFLQKPFTPVTLARTLRQLLDSGRK
jgi:two-component system cell cycle sensor histidine kinase/response regulator CckA